MMQHVRPNKIYNSAFKAFFSFLQVQVVLFVGSHFLVFISADSEKTFCLVEY